MSKVTAKEDVSLFDKNEKPEQVYKAPEVFEVGSAKKLIQGPMLEKYHDDPGRGYTLFP